MERVSPTKAIHALRPKTCVSSSEAHSYLNEDFNPTTDIFYTSEINLIDSQNGKILNEFKILDTIGQGAYSKVKLVSRSFMEDDKIQEAYYGMKILHKPTLKRDRCAVYLANGEIEWSNSLDKIYTEIDVWS